ncbi:hypothetical protein [Providencia rettgeri]|uniref:hypothetical protein n=1 Tax=Providencia rettgeri TaxID=587 RepID=UPI00029BD4AD|nr:hypothetical protein [Providencia rettgeri]EKT53824.1 hypothetical protein OOC_18107 [Providencia rettgeri Dmel1]
MKLHHLALLMFTMPAFAVETPLQTTGTIYVHARLVTPPCQPKVTEYSGVNHNNFASSQLNISFTHCVDTKQVYRQLPFSLKLGNESFVLPKYLVNHTIFLSMPANNSARRLEIDYD